MARVMKAQVNRRKRKPKQVQIVKRATGKASKTWKLKIKAPKTANKNKKRNLIETTAPMPSAVKLIVNKQFIELYGLAKKISEVNAPAPVNALLPVRLTPLTIALKRVDIDGDQPGTGGRCLSPDITEIVRRRVVKISLSRLGLSKSKGSVMMKKPTATPAVPTQNRRNTRNSGGTGMEISPPPPDLPLKKTSITKPKPRAPRMCLATVIKKIKPQHPRNLKMQIYETENENESLRGTGILPTRYSGCTKPFKIVLQQLDLNPTLLKQLEKSVMKMNADKWKSVAKTIFKCDSCTEEFSSKEALLTHQSCHSSTKTRTYPCESCPETFQYASALLTHMLLHSEEMKYKCGNCSQRFQHAINFNAHTLSRRCTTK